MVGNNEMRAVVKRVRKYNMRSVYVMERPTVRLSLGGCWALSMATGSKEPKKNRKVE